MHFVFSCFCKLYIVKMARSLSANKKIIRNGLIAILKGSIFIEFKIFPWAKKKDCGGLKRLKLQRNQNSHSSILEQIMRCKIPLTKIWHWTAGCELWSRLPGRRPQGWAAPNSFLLLLRYWPIILQLLRITKASLGRDRGMQILSSMTNKVCKHGNSEKQFLLKKCENIVDHGQKPQFIINLELIKQRHFLCGRNLL